MYNLEPIRINPDIIKDKDDLPVQKIFLFIATTIKQMRFTQLNWRILFNDSSPVKKIQVYIIKAAKLSSSSQVASKF